MRTAIIRATALGLALSSTGCVFAVGGPHDWEEWDEHSDCAGHVEDLEHRIHVLEKRVAELRARNEALGSAHD